jgi:hypothetical protein
MAETLITLTLVVLVGSVLTASLAFLGFSVTESRVQSEIEDDTLLALQQLMRDSYVAANVAPQAGGQTSGPNQIVLRIPRRTDSGDFIPDRFEFVVYRVVPEGEIEPFEGLIREVYVASEEAQEEDINAVPGPGDLLDRKQIKKEITYLAVDYGGVQIGEVDNLSLVSDIGYYVSGSVVVGEREPYEADTYIQVALRNRRPFGWNVHTDPVGP